MLTSFPDWCGFYLGTGDFECQKREESTIGIRLLTDPGDTDRLIGGIFRLDDFQFALAMTPLHDTQKPAYRVKRVIDTHLLRSRQVIRLDWANLARSA